MSIQSWIEQHLWEGNYFMPARLGERVEIFRSGVSYPFLASLIDGCHGTALWSPRAGRSLTEALFVSIHPLVLRYGASWFYITDPDNALSVFHWERAIRPDYLNSYPLHEFETNPAQEGGAGHLGIAFHHREAILLFELSGSSFTISLYATSERAGEFRACLQSPRPGE